ncbi:MAG TPA: outer membrane protein assembly factor BamC [Rhodoferax sp.]|nr:outer membrane protein assembly factor BamC [Rhodoferax sp.]
MNPISRLALLGLTLTLGACTVLEGDKVDYKSAGKVPTLEVPPDLTQLSRETRYVVPGSSVTASSFQIGQTSTQTTPTATSSLGDVRIERAGTQRWLVISRPADALWEPVKDFWLENGFLLVMEQANLGIMETDWAENRAKIPQDIIRSTIGKVFDSLYSTGERDKFRTRLERNASGGTEVFISHRGMIEVYSSTAKDQTVWQPRAADPELEAEFLRRLMVKLGVSQEQSKALIAAGTVTQSARIDTVNGQPVVRLDDNFDRAWRRVGLALDRTNFTVEDRDRSKGAYFVRYVAPSADKAEPGFFGKLFGSSAKANAPQTFKVSVVSQDNTSLVSVQNADGSPAAAADAQRIVKVLAEDLQ